MTKCANFPQFLRLWILKNCVALEASPFLSVNAALKEAEGPWSLVFQFPLFPNSGLAETEGT